METDENPGGGLTRRRLIQAAAASAAGAGLLSIVGCSLEESGAAGHPNVLLLIIDSVRPDHIGCYGSPQVQTPNIDRLAARGLRFNRAFPEANVTIPARRSLFTSRRIFPYRNWKPDPSSARARAGSRSTSPPRPSPPSCAGTATGRRR